MKEESYADVARRHRSARDSHEGDVLLEVIGLTKTFVRDGHTFSALDDVAFTIRRGEVLGVIGESGSGKSTIAKCLLGLHGVSGGSIRFDGRELTGLIVSERKDVYRRMQMVFQDATASFNPRGTIGHAIVDTVCRLCAETKRDAEVRAASLLESVGLPAGYMKKYPHEMSGGECQRAAIARAMAVHPELLVCDEMTSALDVGVQADIIDLLVRLKDETGVGVLFITHDLPLAATISNRLLVMRGGRIEAYGSTKEIIFKPQSEYVKELLDSVL